MRKGACIGESRLLHWTTNFKNFFFVSVMNMLKIYLFASVKLEKGHKKILGSSFKTVLSLCYFTKWVAILYGTVG